MVQINRLRLSGFKSFVDKTELDIGQGLNGIVGPNGCGKSNLVEALRWVMGENRAKHMRSGDMEDVIFAGTTARPARSIAEVTVLLDNSDGRAPAPFGASAQIEVTRRIERDKGSQYLVNGKQVRARDVQMLFADALTGAHSPALVSQGRVAQIISAKPTERRQMLEESAGVASLYTRRHEAELRLKAADENLARLDLVIGEMGGRANSLRAQAKQAERYRDLSEHIRRLESLVAWQDWAATRDKLRKEEVRFGETDIAVRDALSKSSTLNVQVEEAFGALDTLRRTDTEERAALQLLRQTAEQMAREAAHRKHEFTDITHQIEQATGDLTLAREQHEALGERAAIIAADLVRLAAEDAGAPDELAQLEAAYAQAKEDTASGENAVLTLQDTIRRAQAERDAAAAALARAQADEARVRAALEAVEEKHRAVLAEEPQDAALAALLAQVADLKSGREAAETALPAAQEALDAARGALNAAREALAAHTQARDMKSREVKGLGEMLARLGKGFEDSLILSLDIPADLARAVAAAASEDGMRARRDAWAGHGDMFGDAEWPAGITPLNTLIDVPAPLAAFASSVGIAPDDATAQRVAPQLLRGQVLATRAGAIWRWDGLQVTADAGESAETRIVALKAQIRDAEKAITDLSPAITSAESTLAEAEAARNAAQDGLNVAQAAAKDVTHRLWAAEEQAGKLQKTVNDQAMRRELAEAQLAQARTQVEGAGELRAQAQAASEALASGAHDDALHADLSAAEGDLQAKRQSRDEASARIEQLKAAAAQARHLRESLEAEDKRTREQLARGQAHAAQLEARIATLDSRKATLAPQVEADHQGSAQQEIMDKIAAAEECVRNASDAFSAADNKARALQSELKKVEEDGATLRERRAVIQATVAALQSEQTRIAAEIEDRFSTSPSALENAVITEWPEGLPGTAKARAERDSLNREREAMGPVNLRAEVELNETETEQARLESEKADLTAAIERLREGIGMLNGEARERIVATFTSVNQHFQSLFKRLFGGGEAYLKLIDSDDPLDAGLEIFAQPPGKSLQSLSLLSGGEQTLTALAMIFAMFMSNPAPVCVLDEVDAPLDDANVDRVCGLLEEMSQSCATRFLIITHHRMTMARMDRLYGVTMAERGVSQLVSVNLAAQGELLEQAHVA
ncbi:MAG: AAA family ATPase [Rhodospirillales bacterium]|nr:MAG: AAA family ATPase [Rhodospirillales bacterium]